MTNDPKQSAPEALEDDDLDQAQGGGREDSIMVIGMSHSVVAPRDAATGLPTGKRQHKPFTG